MTQERFLKLCDCLGYRPLPFNGGYLVAGVKPRHAVRFFSDCIMEGYQPDITADPRRTRVEVRWQPV